MNHLDYYSLSLRLALLSWGVRRKEQRKKQTRSEATTLGRDSRKKNALRYASLERLFSLTIHSVARQTLLPLLFAAAPHWSCALLGIIFIELCSTFLTLDIVQVNLTLYPLNRKVRTSPVSSYTIRNYTLKRCHCCCLVLFPLFS